MNCIKRLKDFVDESWLGLDVGSGGGSWKHLDWKQGDSQRLAEVGMDFVHRKNNVVGSVYNIPFKDNAFQYCASAHVIEHLEHGVEAVREMARVASKLVFANIPRYTRNIEEVEGCVGFDIYYFSEHESEAKKRGVIDWLCKHWNVSYDEALVQLEKRWGHGHSHFGKEGRHAPHCAWYPNKEDCYNLFKEAGCFRNIYVEVCPSNCGEHNLVGYK